MLSNIERKLQRQETILESMIKLEYATRSQLQLLHSLGSIRNANRVLKELGSYVNRCRHRETNEWIYYWSKEGCKYVGSDKTFEANMQIYHTIMRNDIYLYYGQPQSWEVEKVVGFDIQENLGNGIMRKVERQIVPDARFTYNQIRHYLEVDNTQSMRENRSKIKLYEEMLGAYQKTYNKPFNLVFYTNSLLRQKHLQEELSKTQIPYRVYTKRDIQ